MDLEDTRIVVALEEASKKMGFKFTGHFLVEDGDGVEYQYLGLLHHIGSDTGTLICSSSTCPEGNSRESEYSLSIIALDSISSDESITEMLLDLGWHGGLEKPELYGSS